MSLQNSPAQVETVVAVGAATLPQTETDFIPGFPVSGAHLSQYPLARSARNFVSNCPISQFTYKHMGPVLKTTFSYQPMKFTIESVDSLNDMVLRKVDRVVNLKGKEPSQAVAPAPAADVAEGAGENSTSEPAVVSEVPASEPEVSVSEGAAHEVSTVPQEPKPEVDEAAVIGSVPVSKPASVAPPQESTVLEVISVSSAPEVAAT